MTKLTFVHLTLSVSLLSACGAAERDEYEVPGAIEAGIVDGRPATAGDVHSTVGLVFPGWSCTGTLIERDLVVTAAHCVVDEWGAAAPEETLVVAGELDLALAEGAHRVRRIVPHPSYEVEWPSDPPQDLLDYHDIALIFLADPIDHIPPSWPMSMAEFEARIQPDMPLTISGYGLEHEDEYEGSPNLNITETRYSYRSDFEFFAGGIGQPDTCQGDSGGPAYMPVEGQMILVGVTSRGTAFSNIRCGAGGAYTLVSAYIDWIETELETDPYRPELPPPSPIGKETSLASNTAASVLANGCAAGGRPFGEGSPLMLLAAIALGLARRRR